LAAPTVFFDRDDMTSGVTSFPNSQAKFNQFTSTLGSFGVDDIESHLGPTPKLIFGATGIQADAVNLVATPTPGFPVTIDDVALIEYEFFFGGPSLNPLFMLSQPVTGFGTFVTNAGDMGNDNPLTFRFRNTSTNATFDVPVHAGPGWGFDNVFFLGVTNSEPFDEITVLETIDANDGIQFDNVVAGNVPEPSSLLLVALVALCGVGQRMGRR
jgi:hypothetical protein